MGARGPAKPGRKPTFKAFKTALDMTLKEADPNDPEGRRNLRIIAEKLVEMAKDGNIQAIQEIANRTDGKPAQEITSSGDGTVVFIWGDEIEGNARDITEVKQIEADNPVQPAPAPARDI